MKKASCLILFISMLYVLSSTLFAYSAPESALNYLFIEGGADSFQMYFSEMSGNSEKLFEDILGPGTVYDEFTRRDDEIRKNAGLDPDNYDMDSGAALSFYIAYNKERKKQFEYDVINTFAIDKAAFIEANSKLNDEEKYTDEEIELLYAGDLDALLRYTKHPYAYVYNGEIYCFNELLMLDYKLLREMYMNGDLREYLDGFITGKTLLNGDELDENQVEWLNYVSWELSSGLESPKTGTNTIPLLCLAVASALLASCAKRRFARS